jgi:hypothetical protein
MDITQSRVMVQVTSSEPRPIYGVPPATLFAFKVIDSRIDGDSRRVPMENSFDVDDLSGRMRLRLKLGNRPLGVRLTAGPIANPFNGWIIFSLITPRAF